MDEAYLALLHDWKEYRRDLEINDEFNSTQADNGSFSYAYNYSSLASLKSSCFEIVERSDSILEEVAIESKEVAEEIEEIDWTGRSRQKDGRLSC